MTTRVNGGFAAGQWMAGELWYFVITTANFDLTTNAGEPNANDEVLYEALAQVGTPVIMRIENATTAYVALAYAAESTAATVSSAIDAVISTFGGGATASAAAGIFTVV